MRTLLVIVRKDLRLLWRDRAGLVFLTLAPIMVITVAGFSLANLYGTDPTGQTAYEFPVVDEDGGSLARQIRDRLETDRAVRLVLVPNREEAQRLVRDRKRAGTALVIPRGSEAALADGRPASLLIYTDSVKYLERLNVRLRLLELRDALANEHRAEASSQVEEQRQRLHSELDQLQSALGSARARLDAAWVEAERTRDHAAAKLRHDIARAQQQAQEQIGRELAAFAEDVRRELDRQLSEMRTPLRSYVEALNARRADFEIWLAELKRLAGGRASDIPSPPFFPEFPDGLVRLLQEDAPLRLPSPDRLRLSLPVAPRFELPPLPAPPSFDIPEIALPPPPKVPGSLAIEEVSLGGPSIINTFDQNVPGFSVTFLLLGMLLGVSLGLLDERDWGTFERVRAMPIAVANVLGGKLLSRFLVGMVQMVTLLVVGWLAFDVSLGPQPWALLLPIAGIVFAGTGFGLIVAAVAPTREAVLPLGSIVIVTMAAVGGCWWPIDLEPRWMRTVALAFPTTWAMDAFNDLMIRRRTVAVALRPAAVMFAYGTLYLLTGLLLFQRRLRRRP